MHATLKRITVGIALAVSLPLMNIGMAAASDDLPRSAGTVGDSVQVAGTVDLIGYTGNIFSRDRVTSQYTFSGSVNFEVGDRQTFIAQGSGCAADNFVASNTDVMERREDGAVRAYVVAWMWDSCPVSGHHGPWRNEEVWVAPNTSETIAFSMRSDAGGATVSVTFTNNWAPKVDAEVVAPPAHWIWEALRDYWHFVLRDAVPAEIPKSEDPKADDTKDPKTETKANEQDAKETPAEEMIHVKIDEVVEGDPVETPPLLTTIAPQAPVIIDVPTVDLIAPLFDLDLGALFNG